MIKSNLWVERYRPQTIDGYVFTDNEIRNTIEHWINQGNIPHLLFYGPAGTGKTTLAKILINSLGVEPIDVLVANGSKEGRKIEWVDKLINFCSTMPFGPMKIVLIDEADYLNPTSVQPAMRNLMEDFSDSVRFICTCNYPQRIIPPIKSRFHEIHIDKTDYTEFTARAATILVEENINFDLEVLDIFVKSTYPDLRKCINLLQAHSTDGSLSSARDASSTDDYLLSAVQLIKDRQYRRARQLICDQVNPQEVEDLFRWAYNNLDLWSSTPEGQDQAIVVIRNGLVAHTTCGDPEINLSATLIELCNIKE